MAVSFAVRAIGPNVSREADNGMVPKRLTRPEVGFKPVIPLQQDGKRIEPPVSDPMAPKISLEDTAAPDPLEEPPVI